MALPDSFHFSMSSDDQSVNGFSEDAENKIIIAPFTIRKVQTEREALKRAQELALKIMKEKMTNPKSIDLYFSAKNCNKLNYNRDSNISMRPTNTMDPYQYPKYNNFRGFASPYKNQEYNVTLHQQKPNQVILNNVKDDSKCNNLFDNEIYRSQIMPISQSLAHQYRNNGIGINYSELYLSYGTSFNNEEEIKMNQLLEEIYSFGEETRKKN
jgi:hypothetical protein